MSSNHRLFRAVNEHIRDMNGLDGDGSVRFLCECGLDDCVAALSISVEGFDEIAASTGRFVVTSAHLRPEADRLVEAHDGNPVVLVAMDERWLRLLAGENTGHDHRFVPELLQVACEL